MSSERPTAKLPPSPPRKRAGIKKGLWELYKDADRLTHTDAARLEALLLEFNKSRET